MVCRAVVIEGYTIHKPDGYIRYRSGVVSNDTGIAVNRGTVYVRHGDGPLRPARAVGGRWLPTRKRGQRARGQRR